VLGRKSGDVAPVTGAGNSPEPVCDHSKTQPDLTRRVHIVTLGDDLVRQV
jgi:hypothetical protein